MLSRPLHLHQRHANQAGRIRDDCGLSLQKPMVAAVLNAGLGGSEFVWCRAPGVMQFQLGLPNVADLQGFGFVRSSAISKVMRFFFLPNNTIHRRSGVHLMQSVTLKWPEHHQESLTIFQ